MTKVSTSQQITKELPWLQPLAAWVSGLDADSLPERVKKRIAACAIDWWGALAAGCNHRLAETYRHALAVSLSPTGTLSAGCSVAGWSGYYLLEQAAPANAAISHLAEVDDGHKGAAMHPGITVFPTVIALAERYHINRTDIQAAIVAGYEVGLKVGTLLGKHHYAVCHTTATAGCFGAAAAAARLLKLSPQQTLFAFGHAGTQAAGLWQFLDDGAQEAKAFHPAAATRNGLMAVNLARNELPAATRILEGRRGLLQAWGLNGDATILSVPDSDCYQIETTTIKGWPVCGQMHTSLDALNDLLPQLKDIRQIAGIRVKVPKAQLEVANITHPRNYEEAKFSSRFCLSFLLHERKLDFENFGPHALNSAVIRSFMDKITLEEDPDFTSRFPKDRPAHIQIILKNGALLERERHFRRGDPEQPWHWDDLVCRFTSIASHLDAEAQQKFIAWSTRCGQSETSSTVDLSSLFNCLHTT